MKLRTALLTAAILVFSSIPRQASAQESGFSIQVSPSPIVAVFKPGEKRDVELKIQNTGSSTENLKIELRSFSIDEQSGEVKISDEAPEGIDSWITLSDPTFTVDPKSWFTQKINVDVGEDRGFSYSFVVMISRQKPPQAKDGESALVGSVAVFALFGIDKPGATREFNVKEFKSTKKVYDYLPAEFVVKLSNTGNTMLLPYGNIFIQRGTNPNEEPLAVLPLNKNAGYLLPGVSREFKTHWEDGFPRYELKKEADNVEVSKKLTWDFSRVQNLRFGKYTAKLVAVYNDGERDVPVESTITFWVIPWRPIIFLLVIIVLIVVGLMATGRSVFGRFKKGKRAGHDTHKEK